MEPKDFSNSASLKSYLGCWGPVLTYLLSSSTWLNGSLYCTSLSAWPARSSRGFSVFFRGAVKMMVLAVFQGSAWAARGPPGGRQGASRGPRGVENWGRFLVHPYARRTSSRDPYHQVGGTPRGCRIDNCFLRFRTVAKLLSVLRANYLVLSSSTWLNGSLYCILL